MKIGQVIDACEPKIHQPRWAHILCSIKVCTWIQEYSTSSKKTSYLVTYITMQFWGTSGFWGDREPKLDWGRGLGSLCVGLKLGALIWVGIVPMPHFAPWLVVVVVKDGRFRLRNRSRNRNRFQILPIWSRNRNRNQLFLPYWNRSRNRNHNNGPESESEPESCIRESVHDSRITVNYDNYFSYFGFNVLTVWIGLQTQLVQYFILCYLKSMSPYGLTKWMIVWHFTPILSTSSGYE